MPDSNSFRDSSHFYVRTTFVSLRTSSDLRIAADGLCISCNIKENAALSSPHAVSWTSQYSNQN